MTTTHVAASDEIEAAVIHVTATLAESVALNRRLFAAIIGSPRTRPGRRAPVVSRLGEYRQSA